MTVDERSSRRGFLRDGLALGLVASTGSVFAQPGSRPVKWMVAYPAGSGQDNLIRAVSEVMARQSGQAMIVDNRPGAAGAVAATAAKSSAADGYTILSMDMGTYTITPYFYKGLSYDPLKDFRMVGMMVVMPLLLAVPTSLNVSTLDDFVKLVKSKPPGSFDFGSSGAGGITHLTMELFMQEAGIKMTHIPYKGSNLVAADLAANRLAAMIVDKNTLLPFVQSGKARFIAVASNSRLKTLPEIPTLKERGFKFNLPFWIGAAVPKETPDAVVEKINQSLNKAMSDPQLLARLDDFGVVASDRLSSKAVEAYAQSDYTRVQDLVKKLNVKLE